MSYDDEVDYHDYRRHDVDYKNHTRRVKGALNFLPSWDVQVSEESTVNGEPIGDAVFYDVDRKNAVGEPLPLSHYRSLAAAIKAGEEALATWDKKPLKYYGVEIRQHTTYWHKRNVEMHGYRDYSHWEEDDVVVESF